jgi:membrane protein
MSGVPIKEITSLLRVTIQNWERDRVPRLGAALAYYVALSLAPTVVITIAVAGWAFGAKAAEGRLVSQIQGLVGQEATKAIQAMIEGAHDPSRGVVGTLLALVTFFFGATAVVSELTDALNTIWKVPDDMLSSTGQSIFKLVKERLLAFALVLGAGLFLLASVILNVWISVAGKYLRSVAVPPQVLVQAIDWAVSLVVITALLAFIFRVLPQVPLEWADVIPGAVLTSLLFTAGKFLLGVYLAQAGFTDTYGAAGSLVILLVWIYYSAQVVYLGAEFTRVYTLRFGSMVAAGCRRPAPNAEGHSRP